MSPNALNLTQENQKKSYCYKQKNIFNRRKETKPSQNMEKTNTVKLKIQFLSLTKIKLRQCSVLYFSLDHDLSKVKCFLS